MYFDPSEPFADIDLVERKSVRTVGICRHTIDIDGGVENLGELPKFSYEQRGV